MRLRRRSKRLLMLRSLEASDAIRQGKVPIIALFAICWGGGNLFGLAGICQTEKNAIR